jgi:hypothetical protein
MIDSVIYCVRNEVFIYLVVDLPQASTRTSTAANASIHAVGVLLVPLFSSDYAYAVSNRAMLSYLTHGSSGRLFYLTMVTATATAIVMTAVCLSATVRMNFTHTYETIRRCK